MAGDPELHEYLRVSSAAFPESAGLAALIRETGLRVTALSSRLGGLVTMVAAEDSTSQ
jgi:hypothetical protein